MLLPVVLTLIATHDDNSKVVDLIADMCYTKWALEAFVVSNAKRFEHQYQFSYVSKSVLQNWLGVSRA